MSYSLRPDRSARKEIHRVTRKRLKKARAALTAPAKERASGIHQARKRLKEMRAVLRLVRGPLGKAFASENERLRDTARLLSSSRDVTAIVESWDALMAADNNLSEAVAVGDIRKRLASRKADKGSLTEKEAIVQALACLESFETDMTRWNLGKADFELYGEGLESIYRKGRKALAKAARHPSSHNLHEWRKRVKDHWYHTRLLVLAWPDHQKLRSALLKKLAELLGDEHDLYMLCLLMEEQPELFGEAESCQRIDEAINQRRQLLQSRALQLGRRLYAESPKALRKRWERYWKVTRRE